MKIVGVSKKMFPMVSATCTNPLCEEVILEINAREVSWHTQGRNGWYSIVCPVCGHEIEIPYTDFSPEFLEEMRKLKGMH